MNQTDFSTLQLHPQLLTNLDSLGYRMMTPIQAQSLPHILSGRDVIGQGKTGSGKTAAFALGLLQALDAKCFSVQSLVLCPTRELADQVAKEIRTLARTLSNIKVLTLCGGLPIGPQFGSLEHGAHIVVGTPGRVQDHVRRGSLRLNQLQSLVLDEADRMLEMGFQEAMDAIIDTCPSRRQTLLFSATYPPQIQSIAKRVMVDPELIKVDSTHDSTTIVQQFHLVQSNERRLEALQLVLKQHRPASTVVFCNTKRETDEVAQALAQEGFSVLALHGDLEQKMRDQILVRFANKSVSILVATDVAARGLDIDALDLVINYRLALDAEVHTHRIGRTGRAGSKGRAHTFYHDRDGYKLTLLEDHLQWRIEPSALPPLSLLQQPVMLPEMSTIRIDGGKKNKVRPGDIVGALTANKSLSGDDLGKIHIFDHCAYVAVQRDAVKAAINTLSNGKIKGRSFRSWVVRG